MSYSGRISWDLWSPAFRVSRLLVNGGDVAFKQQANLCCFGFASSFGLPLQISMRFHLERRLHWNHETANSRGNQMESQQNISTAQRISNSILVGTILIVIGSLCGLC
ncbi:hypothetical protein MFFC18_40080 [Mariniblastus fucicola]|uniref:Uncharacterized protein n=1 Tax=Mariniblastus fucicola TaxID=980251 RepID=A0A5B9PHA2_9BACT|nr:hypothetical protein MFFC18_40080 [Mariniblastus fucicola]